MTNEELIQTNNEALLNSISAKSLVEQTIEERGKVYGDPYESHVNIGLAWTALLRQGGYLIDGKTLPASMVAQMMVMFKMQRSAKVYKDDNYIDAHAYANFADEFQKREQELKNKNQNKLPI